MSVHRMVRGVVCLAVLLGFLTFLAACQTRGAVSSGTATAGTAAAAVANDRSQAIRRERGERAYLSSCAMCHGVWGEGDGPLAAELKQQSGVSPAQLNDPKKLEEIGRANLIQIISLGGGRTHRSNLMPPWGGQLPANVIGEVADYVMALPSIKPGVPRQTVEKYLESPAGVPSEGRRLFVFYCSMCHGPYGKGDGFEGDSLWARHHIRPRNLTDSVYFAQKTDKELYVTVALGGPYTRHSPFMPAWSATLTPAQLKDLVSYVRALSRTESRP